MKIYVRDYHCNKKYFDTLNDAIKYIRRYSHPNGSTYTIWIDDDTGSHVYRYYRKDENGKLIIINIEG